MYKCLTCADNNQYEFKNVQDNIITLEELQVVFKEIECKNQVEMCDIKGQYQTNLVVYESEVLFKKARKICRQAEDVAVENRATGFDIGIGRRQVINLLSACRCTLLSFEAAAFEETILKNLRLLHASILPLRDLSLGSLNKLVTNTTKINELPVSQYFHMYFDVQWLILTINYICRRDHEQVYEILENILQDLIVVAQISYEKQGTKASPFVCPCVKHLWCSLECFTEKAFKSKTEFWEMFNKLIKTHDEMFSLWLLAHLAIFQRDLLKRIPNKSPSDNSIIIEQKLKSIITKSANTEHNILKALQILQPLLTDVWLDNAKIDPYLLLWEHFFKQLNHMDTKIPKKTVEFIEALNAGKAECSCYELFIRMLGAHLKKHPSHWTKLKGRVYSRLPVQKIGEFSDKGIYNISMLFLGLVDVNFKELVDKLLDLLENLPKDRHNSELLCSIYISLVAKHVVNGKDIDRVSVPILQMLEEASSRRDKFHLIKAFIEGLDYILNISENYQLKQSKLLGTWTVKYVQSCQFSELCYFVNILIWTVERVYKTDGYFEWLAAFSTFILPAMQEVVVAPNPPPQSGRLAALIVRQTPEKVAQAVKEFTSESVSPKVINQFLCTLLEEQTDVNVISASSELLIIQACVNCSLLNSEISEHVTRKVLKFHMLSFMDVTIVSQNPFSTILEAIKHSHNAPVNRLKEACACIFGQIDRVVARNISITSPDQTIAHIYSSISRLFYNCAHLIYDKYKSNCLLSRLVSLMLLPTEVLMGRAPSLSLLRAIEASWYTFVQGLFKLDYSGDPFINRTLRDLVLKYVPHFTPSDSPVLFCLNNEEIASFVLDKISDGFLSHASRNSDEIAFKALKTIQNSIQRCRSEAAMKLIVQKAIPGVLETVMFSANKSHAIEILKLLALSDWYVQVRVQIKDAVIIVLKKHLGFNANYFFQLTSILVKLIPLDMRLLLPEIKNQIVVVERKRGVGYDNTLQCEFHKLESSLAL